MYRRMLFNARTHARDDHVRNHAFLMDQNGVWTPAPAYDVTFDVGPGGEHSMDIAGEGAQPGQTAFSKVAEVFRIKKKRASEILDEVDTAVAQWPTLAKNHAVGTRRTQDIQSLFQSIRTWA
jgi:serine/threonine-protein kinase HipA